MKQGGNKILAVKVNADMSQVEKIMFVFEQANKRKVFTYPSEKAKLDISDENVIDLYWSYADTYYFEADKPVYMDTLIKFYGYDSTPDTEVKTIIFDRTLFRQAEVKEFYG